MFILKLLAKIVVLPIALILWALKWVGLFFTSMSYVIFIAIASLLFFLAIFSYVTDPADTFRLYETLAFSFAFFVIPNIAGWVVCLLDSSCDALFGFIRA